MGYAVLPVLVILAVMLLAALVLVVDGVRRVIREFRGSNRDLRA